jgi:hypothetical protein
MGAVSERPGDRRARKEIRREWEASGRPPCPICGAPIDGTGKVSHLWRAVVHPFCVYAKVTRQPEYLLEPDPCPLYPDCPILFRGGEGGFCVCPRNSSINIIFVARRLGQSRVAVSTWWSPASERAARKAGLSQEFKRVPLREFPRFDLIRKYGTLAPGVDDSIWDGPRDVNEPPEYVTVDTERTLNEGRVVLVEAAVDKTGGSLRAPK